MICSFNAITNMSVLCTSFSWCIIFTNISVHRALPYAIDFATLWLENFEFFEFDKFELIKQPIVTLCFKF